VSETLRSIRAYFPILQRLHRVAFLAIADSRFYVQWTKAGARRRKTIEKQLAAWMIDRAPPNLKDKIVPDFPFQAKRYIFEDGYFASINQPQNKAIYGRIASLTPEGVKTDDGEILPADVVVLSTGYDADHIDMQVAGESDSTEKYSGKSDLTYYHGVSTQISFSCSFADTDSPDDPPGHAQLLHHERQQHSCQPQQCDHGSRDPGRLYHQDGRGDARRGYPQA
jgi:cation diffusion facilitator CzcD-associated flavoprotein CzcO